MKKRCKMDNIRHEQIMLSVYHGNLGRSKENRPPSQILKSIRVPGEKLVSEFNKVRKALEAGDKQKYEQFKVQLEAVTFSGLFNGERKKDQCTVFSGIACLDLDHVSESGRTISDVREAIQNLPQTLACFLSPSGDGLKVLVPVSCREVDFEIMYAAILNLYQQRTGVKFDTKTKDICRLCFISYDPDLFYRDTALPFIPKCLMLQEIEYSRKFAEKRYPRAEGRNNHVYLFCCCLHRFGVAADEIKKYCIENCVETGFDETEVTLIVESAVKNPDGNIWSIDNPPKQNQLILNDYQRKAALEELELLSDNAFTIEQVARNLLDVIPKSDADPGRLYVQFVRNLQPAAKELSARKPMEGFLRRVMRFSGQSLEHMTEGLSDRSRILSAINDLLQQSLSNKAEMDEWRKTVIFQTYAADKSYARFQRLFYKLPNTSRSQLEDMLQELQNLERVYNAARRQVDDVLEAVYLQRELLRQDVSVLADVALTDQ